MLSADRPSAARNAMWCTEPRPMRPGRKSIAGRAIRAVENGDVRFVPLIGEQGYADAD